MDYRIGLQIHYVNELTVSEAIVAWGTEGVLDFLFRCGAPNAHLVDVAARDGLLTLVKAIKWEFNPLTNRFKKTEK